MKRINFLIVMVLVSGLLLGCQGNEAPFEAPMLANDAGDMAKADFDVDGDCVTIQSGELENSVGDVIELGFDVWGYNYQARLFEGLYCESYRNAVWCEEYKDVRLVMKWNDAWLSNKDCDEDGLLDRHLGFTSYIGSGAWLTNVQSGEYEDEEGTICKWNYFVKIVAAPDGAIVVDGNWEIDGVIIGPVIWGSFAIIQQIDNDGCAGTHGVQFTSPLDNGLGNW